MMGSIFISWGLFLGITMRIRDGQWPCVCHAHDMCMTCDKIIFDLIMTDFFTLLVCGIHCVHANDYFGMRMLPHMCKYPHVAACAWLALEKILNIKLAKMGKKGF